MPIKPNSERTPEKIRENAIKAGKASGKARREKKLISQIYADMLLKKHKIGKEEIGGEVLLEKVALKVLGRGDSASVSMLKEIREATEGSKQQIELTANINTDDEKVKSVLEKHGIKNSKD